jgi:hypothetical protein
MTPPPVFTPKNVYVDQPFLDPELRRVAILPLTIPTENAAFSAGKTTLETVLIEELGKTRLCEFVPIPAQSLEHWLGRSRWLTTDRLPTNFFAKITDQTGCDAILFAHLAHYSAYPPLRIGWQLRLVDAKDHHTLWSADEVFDADNPEVANGARAYAKASNPHDREADPSFILNSPRRFGHYSASTLFSTLPKR